MRKSQMLKRVLMAGFLGAVVNGCASNPNKVQKVETNLDSKEKVTGNQLMGIKKDETLVVQEKTDLRERLRDLQNEVYALEDKVYGMRKYDSLGLYGDLRNCEKKTASKQYGGPGVLVWTEPLDRVSDKEKDYKFGKDEQNNLVSVSEEFVKDRLERFQNYKFILQKREDEFKEKIETCNNDLAQKKIDTQQSSKVLISEGSKALSERPSLNNFMCDYVKQGASLKDLLLAAFSERWLHMSDLPVDQALTTAKIRDQKGKDRENGFLFMGWKLAYDKPALTLGDVLSGNADAKLEAWTYPSKKDVANASKCLSKADGVWND